MKIKATTPCYKFRDAKPEEQICKTCATKFIIKSLPTLPEKIIIQHIKFKAVE